MPLLTSFFNTIKEGMAVRVAVPLLGISEEERLHGFYGKGEPPAFTITFPEGSLAVEQVDISRLCQVRFDFIHQTVSIAATITGIQDNHTLQLVAQETVTHTHSRNYFRVDASTRVAASSLIPEQMAQDGETWRLLGDTIDLSGSGALCSFSEPLEKDTQAKIELTLPTREMEVITAFGHVVRCRKIKEHLYHIALHFDAIDSESQDKIMACCFELQRRYLRMRVRLEGVTNAA